jgi:hypothetical protein
MRKLFTTAAALIAFCVTSHAQSIKYHDVSPDTTIAHWEQFRALGVAIWWHPTPEVVVRTWDSVQVLCLNDTIPKALNAGDSIAAGSAGVWKKQNYTCLNCGGTIGAWKGVTDKYLAVRDKNSSGQWVYGWIRLDVAANAGRFTIKDYAIHKVANTSVKAGQMVGTGIADGGTKQYNISHRCDNRSVVFTGFIGKAVLTVTDMSGRVVGRETITQDNRFSMSGQPSGIYLFHLQNEQVNETMRIAFQ